MSDAKAIVDKTRTLTRSDLDDFVMCYRPGRRGRRNESGRFRRFSYDELVARDNASLDIVWLRDESLEDGHQALGRGLCSRARQ